MESANRPELIEHWVFEVIDVARLPVPNELRDPDCMRGPWRRTRRRIRQLAPWLIGRQDPRDCCWHHQADWRTAAGVAVRLVREAYADGLDGGQICDYVTGALDGEGLNDRAQSAVWDLVYPSAGILLNEDPATPWRYEDGQHRAAAQIDQGVRQTIIQRLELLDPATGRPITD